MGASRPHGRGSADTGAGTRGEAGREPLLFSGRGQKATGEGTDQSEVRVESQAHKDALWTPAHTANARGGPAGEASTVSSLSGAYLPNPGGARLSPIA